jgi:hypothetical protein
MTVGDNLLARADRLTSAAGAGAPPADDSNDWIFVTVDFVSANAPLGEGVTRKGCALTDGAAEWDGAV